MSVEKEKTRKKYSKRQLSFREVSGFGFPENLYIDAFILFQPEDSRIYSFDGLSYVIPQCYRITLDTAFATYKRYHKGDSNAVRNIWIVLDKYEHMLSAEELMSKYSLTKEGILRVCQDVLRSIVFYCGDLLLKGLDRYEVEMKQLSGIRTDIRLECEYIPLSNYIHSVRILDKLAKGGMRSLSDIIFKDYPTISQKSGITLKEFKNMVEYLKKGLTITYDYYSEVFIVDQKKIAETRDSFLW